jgi:hypothetical protein
MVRAAVPETACILNRYSSILQPTSARFTGIIRNSWQSLPTIDPAIVRSQRSPHAPGRDGKPSENCKVLHRTVEQPIRRISKNRQGQEAKIFKTFACAARAQSDLLAKLQNTRFFPSISHLNCLFMLATLELNTRHNRLCDSTLRHTRNCIDAPQPKCKIELPKPHHIVPVRAWYTIGCGLRRTQSLLYRVLGIRSPKSGTAFRIDPFATDLIACVQTFTLVLVGCPLTLALGRMPRWPQQTLNP